MAGLMKIAVPVFIASFALAAGKPLPADLLISNARVYTVERSQPWAEAVAIRDGKIVAVGSSDDLAKYRGARTRVVDAGQRLIMPGFFDSHIHFLEGSLSLGQLRLDETKNLADIQKAVKAFAEAHAQAAWILGRGWSYSEFGRETLPNKKDLDAVVADRPVLLEGFDGHTYWANSKALALAGVRAETPNPPNGEIVRDPRTGEPTGALKEAAGDLLLKVAPQPSAEERLAALRQGMRLAHEAGLTHIINCGNDTPGASDDQFFDLYDRLRRQGELTLRVTMSDYQPPDGLRAEDLKKIEADKRNHPPSDDWLAGGAVKMFLDGVIESHTAALLAPYADDPAKTGSLRWTPDHYKKAVAELDKQGIQVFTHAIGDRAVRLALDAYEEAATRNRTSDARHRIEHIETISAQDIPRFGKLNVIASFQPLHAYPDDDTMNVWLKNAGHEREPRAWAWQSIWQSGGHEAFGSDWPVVTLNPWDGVQNAILRQTREGKPAGGWIPDQRLSLEQAIEGYTLGAAYSVHREHEEGSIKPGKLADLVILNQNLFAIDPRKIAETQVLMTIVGGKIVYESPGLPQAKAATKAQVVP